MKNERGLLKPRLDKLEKLSLMLKIKSLEVKKRWEIKITVKKKLESIIRNYFKK